MRHIVQTAGINPDWSPRGDKIVFAGWPDKSGQKLMIVDTTGKNLKVLLDPRRFGFNFPSNLNPQFSPDGNRVVFQMGPVENKDGQIWVVNVDGRKPRQLTSRGGLESRRGVPMGGRSFTFAFLTFGQSSRATANCGSWMPMAKTNGN